MSFVLGGVIGTLLAVFPHVWIPVFTDDPMVYETAKGFIQIVGPCLAIHGVGWALYFASQGRVPCVARWQHSLHVRLSR